MMDVLHDIRAELRRFEFDDVRESDLAHIRHIVYYVARRAEEAERIESENPDIGKWASPGRTPSPIARDQQQPRPTRRSPVAKR